MKRIVQSLVILIAVLLTVSLASCGNIDKKIDEATASLNDEISRLEAEISVLDGEIAELNGQIDALEGENAELGAGRAELEAEKATLEKEKAALEAEKSALEAEKVTLEGEKAALSDRLDEINSEIRCASGTHFYDGESEIKYSWSADQSFCVAEFTCSSCGELAVLSTYDVTVEDDRITAYFGDNVPSTVYYLPVFEGVHFNSDSEGYDEATNTFTVTEETPFILTFTGKNLLNMVEVSERIVYAYVDGGMFVVESFMNPQKNLLSITDTSVTLTIDASYSFAHSCFNGFVIYDIATDTMYENTNITVNVQKEPLPVDSEGYTLVSDENELVSALRTAEKIRLTADIESQHGFQIYMEVLIDLAGYDVIVADENRKAFEVFNKYLELRDSVGNSSLTNGIVILEAARVKIGDAITVGDQGIILHGDLDLSDYSGEELIIYPYSHDTELLLPDGYAMYNMHGELLPNFLDALMEGLAFVRPGEASTDEWVTVSTAEELNVALEDGGKVILAADIESEEGFTVWSDVVIELAGYDITVTSETSASFLVNANCVILDSVGGSEINRNITLNYGSIKVIGDFTLADNIMIVVISGSIDLSDYTGNELYLYVSSEASGVILPDGYSVYSEYDGSLLPDYAPENGVHYVYVRPTEQGSDPEEPTESNGFPVFTLPTEVKANFADYNIPLSEIIAFFPSEVEVKYENGVFTVPDFGATEVEVYDFTTHNITKLTLVDGVWTGEVELDPDARYSVDFYGQAGGNKWDVQYIDGKRNGFARINTEAKDSSLHIDPDENFCFLQIDTADGLIVEMLYTNEALTEQKVIWHASDISHTIEVFYDSDSNFMYATIYSFTVSKYFYFFPEGWSAASYEYVEGGAAAPGYESYTAEDFMALCPPPLG